MWDLQVDSNKGNRFYFPPDKGKTREIIWKPYKKQTKRTVTKLYTQGDRIRIWLHQAAYIKVVFLGIEFLPPNNTNLVIDRRWNDDKRRPRSWPHRKSLGWPREKFKRSLSCPILDRTSSPDSRTTDRCPSR